MAWKYNDRIIRVGRSWTGIALDENGNEIEVTHPRNWAIWSDEDKVAAGLVWEDDPAPFDSRFYWSAGIPKALDDVNEVWSQDQVDAGTAPEGTSAGDPRLDVDGNQIITRGLKWNAVQLVKQQANGKLAGTDWMVVKAAEVADYTVPSDVTTYRAAVRTASNDIEAAISACTTIDEFIALHDVERDAEGTPVDSTEIPVINQWPTEI